MTAYNDLPRRGWVLMLPYLLSYEGHLHGVGVGVEVEVGAMVPRLEHAIQSPRGLSPRLHLASSYYTAFVSCRASNAGLRLGYSVGWEH